MLEFGYLPRTWKCGIANSIQGLHCFSSSRGGLVTTYTRFLAPGLGMFWEIFGQILRASSGSTVFQIAHKAQKEKENEDNQQQKNFIAAVIGIADYTYYSERHRFLLLLEPSPRPNSPLNLLRHFLFSSPHRMPLSRGWSQHVSRGLLIRIWQPASTEQCIIHIFWEHRESTSFVILNRPRQIRQVLLGS